MHNQINTSYISLSILLSPLISKNQMLAWFAACLCNPIGHELNKRDIIDVLVLIFLGWWLSMEPKNHIYRKISNNTVANQLTSKSDARHLVELCDPRLRFATRNDKTLGFKQV